MPRPVFETFADYVEAFSRLREVRRKINLQRDLHKLCGELFARAPGVESVTIDVGESDVWVALSRSFAKMDADQEALCARFQVLLRDDLAELLTMTYQHTALYFPNEKAVNR